jgi:hypothetical protein
MSWGNHLAVAVANANVAKKFRLCRKSAGIYAGFTWNGQQTSCGAKKVLGNVFAAACVTRPLQFSIVHGGKSALTHHTKKQRTDGHK